MERNAIVDETGGAVLAAWPNVSASTPLFNSLVETVKEARSQHARDDGRWSDRSLEDLLSHAREQLRSDTAQVPLSQALLQPKKVGQKDAHAAESWKEQGNRLFASKQWREAIHCYTEALRYAPPPQLASSSSTSSSKDSTAAATEPVKAYAYANRGMALYQMKEYESAVLDLTAALDERHGYPQRRRWKLLHKRGCCWYQQKKVEEALVDCKAAEASLLQPSSASEEAAMKQIRRSLESMHKRKGFSVGENKSKQTKEQHKKEDKSTKFVRAMAGNISDAVQVSYAEHKGRFVRSGRGIDVGEDIVREEAYAAVLLRHYELHRCHHCLRPLSLASTPGYLMFTVMPTLLLLSVRTVLRGLCELLSQQGDEADNHQYLSRVLSKTESQLLFGKDEPTEESVWQGGYLSLYSLLTHSNCLPAETLAQHVLDTALFDLLLYRLLPSVRLPPFISLPTVQHISGLVLHHLCQTQTNVYAIFDVVEERQKAALREPPNPISTERGIIPHTKTTQVRVAEAFFPTASLFNHSCVPNTFLRYHGRTIVIRASRAITAGEEISNCYGPHAIHMPDHEQRQRLLRDQYFFDCDCTACSRSLLPASTVLPDRQLICPTESCNKLNIPLVAATPEAINKDNNNRDTKEEQEIDAQKVLRCSKCNATFSIDKAKQELELATTFFERGVRHWDEALALAEGATNNYNQQVQAAIQKQQNAAVKCLCHCLKLRTGWLSSEQSMEVAKTHDKLAEVYSGLARWKEAAMHCRSGTLIVGQLFGRFSAEMGRECFKLCQLLFNGMQIQEALSAVEDTIAIFNVLVGEDRVDVEGVGGKGDEEEMREELQQMRKYLLDAMTQRHHHPA
ncbi:SET and MYND domain-containing protein 4 [Balamuthia mandrillaris]